MSVVYIFIVLLLLPFLTTEKEERESRGVNQQQPIDFYMKYVKNLASELIEKYGFDAGSGYPEVWIRDTNTFLRLVLDHGNVTEIRGNLTVFFGFQQDDGSIIDGFSPKDKAVPPYYQSKYFPQYAGFKNTVEIDQETSLIQAIHEYVTVTSDRTILDVQFGQYDINQRIPMCLEYLMKHKYNERYGLLYSATRADWGDVQPETNPGTVISNETHWAISIYDNAMFLISIKKYLDLNIPSTNTILEPDPSKNFYKLPFPSSFDESQIYYHGGTAIAILAGLLTKEEILSVYQKMVQNVQEVGGKCSIGLTMYPAYPNGYFKNPSLDAYNYQNGGDWTWFGGRMVWALIENGYVDEAEDALFPMLFRVFVFGDFFEWFYVFDNSPRGSEKYKGSAGVLYQAILMLEEKRKEKK